MLWQAYYALEPWGDEAKYNAMLIAVGMKSGNWERWMPSDYRTHNDPNFQMTPEEEQKRDRSIGRAFSSLAKMLANATED